MDHSIVETIIQNIKCGNTEEALRDIHTLSIPKKASSLQWFYHPTYDGAPKDVQKVLDSVVPGKEVHTDLWYDLIDIVLPALRSGNSSLLKTYTDYPWENVTDEMLLVILIAAKEGFGIKNKLFLEAFHDALQDRQSHNRSLERLPTNFLSETIIKILNLNLDEKILENIANVIPTVINNKNSRQLLEALADSNLSDEYKNRKIGFDFKFSYSTLAGDYNTIYHETLLKNGFHLVKYRVKLKNTQWNELRIGYLIALYENKEGKALILSVTRSSGSASAYIYTGGRKGNKPFDLDYQDTAQWANKTTLHKQYAALIQKKIPRKKETIIMNSIRYGYNSPPPWTIGLIHRRLDKLKIKRSRISIVGARWAKEQRW